MAVFTSSFFKKIFVTSLILLGISCQKQEEIESLLPTGRLPSRLFDPNDSTPLSWNPIALQSTPLDVKISEDYDDEIENNIHPALAMMTTWNNTINFNFFNVSGSFVANKDLDSLASYQDGELGIYKSYKWFDDVTSDAIAVTQYFAYRRDSPFGGSYYEIVHADIILNYSDFSFSKTTPAHPLMYDINTVLLHELGHLLGLSHSSSLSSVMFPSLSEGEMKRTPSNQEKSKLSLLYKGQVSALTKGTMPSSGAMGTEENPILYRGIIELSPDHKCRHYFNNKLEQEHNW